MEALYDADLDKVASASMGAVAEGAKTGAAVKIIKLLALSRAAPLAVTTVEPQAATTEATTAVAATTMMT